MNQFLPSQEGSAAWQCSFLASRVLSGLPPCPSFLWGLVPPYSSFGDIHYGHVDLSRLDK
jgi:hypothetical protein